MFAGDLRNLPLTLHNQIKEVLLCIKTATSAAQPQDRAGRQMAQCSLLACQHKCPAGALSFVVHCTNFASCTLQDKARGYGCRAQQALCGDPSLAVTQNPALWVSLL